MKNASMLELRCSRELGLRLGAREPETVEHHKRLRASRECLLLRDPLTLLPMFWPLISSLYPSTLPYTDE